MLRADSRLIKRPGWVQVITPSAPGTLLNEVIYSQVDAARADAAIDRVVAEYAADGHPVKWCVGPWTKPDDFGERLARRGFSSWDVRGMAALAARAIDRSERADVAGRGHEPRGVAVEEITEQAMPAYVATAVRGWSLPPGQETAELASHLAALRARRRVARFFAARVGGEIAATTALFLKGDHAYLAGAQVLPPHRGKGIYRALVAARLAFLAERGIALAVTHAREATSAPILAHLGFETLFRSQCFLFDPAGAVVPPGGGGTAGARQRGPDSRG